MHLLSLILMLGLSAGITGPTDTLQSVTVTADKGIIVSRADTIKIRPSQRTSDILLGSSALILSDYGGPSGTKNISLRGLGIAHTSIYIDGIRVNNVQNGQSDLGLMDAQLYSRIVIDYAQNSVNFVSSVPELGNKKFQTQISTELGSWETYSGAAQFSMRLSPGITARISARGTKSAGNYEYGAGLTRTNADHQQISAQADLYGSLYQGRWQIKAHYGNNDRGTPGAISWPSQDRQSDIYAFLQGYLNKRISEHYNLTVSAKASQDKMLYLSEWGDSDYKHNNLQLNSSHQFYINDWWNASVATNLNSDKLNSSGYDAQRTSVLVALASAFRFEHLYADISLEYNGTFDKDALSRNTLSPAINLRYVISEQLSAMGFVRRASRVPTFNELYYV
ncbi:MAG: TonB-dependent receptor plug domain-containing protein, partial [Bacteroidales bacterium]|nr:TonB-dependent receptor plug domain-containing protein [Bacteroidales bacterium]